MSTTAPAVECCAPLGAPVLSEADALATSGVFGALAGPHRVRIVNLLACGGPSSEEHLIEPLALSQATVSHHLKKLTEGGLSTASSAASRPISLSTGTRYGRSQPSRTCEMSAADADRTQRHQTA